MTTAAPRADGAEFKQFVRQARRAHLGLALPPRQILKN